MAPPFLPSAVRAILSEIRDVYQSSGQSSVTHFTEKDMQKWGNMLGALREVLYDKIASCLACGFHNLELTFEFCDSVMNGLHEFIVKVNDERPDLFWDIYLAFDEGEYYHGNNRDDDPVEVYTRPMIAQIVEKGTFA